MCCSDAYEVEQIVELCPDDPMADGEADPTTLAALADQRLRASPAQLYDALGACTELNPVYRRLVKMTLEGLQFVEQQIGQLDQEIASLLQRHQDAVERLAVVPELCWRDLVAARQTGRRQVGVVGAVAAHRAMTPNRWRAFKGGLYRLSLRRRGKTGVPVPPENRF